MIAHPIAYVIMFFVIFLFIGVSSGVEVADMEDKIIRDLESKKQNWFFYYLRLHFTLKTIAYTMILTAITLIAVVMCYLSSDEMKSVIAGKYSGIAFFLVLIKRLLDFITAKIREKRK